MLGQSRVAPGLVSSCEIEEPFGADQWHVPCRQIPNRPMSEGMAPPACSSVGHPSANGHHSVDALCELETEGHVDQSAHSNRLGDKVCRLACLGLPLVQVERDAAPVRVLQRAVVLFRVGDKPQARRPGRRFLGHASPFSAMATWTFGRPFPGQTKWVA